MVRPRTGDFVYSEPELSVMLEDIATFAQIGVNGVVLGVLTPDASIDVASTTLLAQAASEAGLKGLNSCYILPFSEHYSDVCGLPF